jgi:mitogen-activated protein kinase 1/3
MANRRVTVQSEAEIQAQQRQAAPAPKIDKEARFRESWKVPARYYVRQPLGSGAYGQVCEAEDRVMNRPVAIKQAKHLLDDLIDAKRILREVAILDKLSHSNVIKLYDIVVPADLTGFNEVYMVLEMADSDLKKLCRSEVHLTNLHVTTLLYNLLVGLNYLHSAGIWHRDLKPANCLVNEDCTVKICDFGLSRAMGVSSRGLVAEDGHQKEKSRALTGHVVTRWYRAPELILLQEDYTEAIDVWSVACIYAELLGMLKGTAFKERAPLFPGHSCFPLSPNNKHKTDTKYYTKGTQDQLSMICSLIGTPSADDVQKLDGEDARTYMRAFEARAGGGVKAKFAQYESPCIDLLEKMLVFIADKRISVADSLKHPLFAKVRVPARETRADTVVDLDFEREPELDEHHLRKLFLREIRQYHPEVPEL